MSEIKVCVGCKFFGMGKNDAYCNRVIGEEVDLVYGKSFAVDKRTAREIRADEASCGPEGKHFEAKEKQPFTHAGIPAYILKQADEDYASNKKPDWWRIKRYFA